MNHTILPLYNMFMPAFIKGEGVYLYDTDGKRYVDFACGYGVNALGHCHPHVVKALTDQAQKVWHISNMFHHPLREQLADRFTAACFADKVFFTNSGVEAWELGLKMTRKYFAAKGQPQKYRLICMDGAFHGRTMGAISAAPRDYMVDGFQPLLDGFDIVPFNDIAALKSAITPNTAAIHLEPIQGEGGIRPHAKDYMQAVKELAAQHDLLIFYDEVQCGMGRTGHLFAGEGYYGVAPDILCTAKGIGTGFPLGALLANDKAASAMTAGSHGSTYAGNPLAMAVGNAVLDIMLADDFMPQVRKLGDHLSYGLQKLMLEFPEVYIEHRGLGLIQGLQCAPAINNRALIETMHAAGVISIPSGENTVRILPPLIISETEIDEGIAAMKIATQKFMKGKTS